MTCQRCNLPCTLWCLQPLRWMVGYSDIFWTQINQITAKNHLQSYPITCTTFPNEESHMSHSCLDKSHENKKSKLHSNTAVSCLNRISISTCWLNLLLFCIMIICQDAARVRTLQRKQQVWLFWHTWLRYFEKWIDPDHKLCRTLLSVVCRWGKPS